MRAAYEWHDLSNTRGVFKVVFLAVVGCLLPAVAAGQPWAEAYKAGEFAKAAELLQPLVVEQVQAMRGPSDPAPARHLAMIYAHGSGVSREPVLACALARLSDLAVQTRQPEPNQDPLAYLATIDESKRFVRTHCAGLTDRQQLAASPSLGCFAFGMTEGTLSMGTQTVWFDRLGLRLSESPPEQSTSDLPCLQLVARIGSQMITPPSDAAPGVRARSFVEVLGWQATPMAGDSDIRYLLTWMMFELRGTKLELVAIEHLSSTAGWPRVALPPDFEARFSVEMIRSGHIRWRLDDAPPKRGWIMLRESEAR